MTQGGLSPCVIAFPMALSVSLDNAFGNANNQLK